MYRHTIFNEMIYSLVVMIGPGGSVPKILGLLPQNLHSGVISGPKTRFQGIYN